MNTIQRFSFAFAMMGLIAFISVNVFAQSPNAEVKFVERNLGGPRLGFTYFPSGSQAAKGLDKYNMGQLISQFGWHLEKLIVPDEGGPSFVVQFTPMVAGVEYGKIMPNATLAFGIRMPDGFEFGMGPNIYLGEQLGTNTALTMAVGKSFNYGGVSIPLDLAYTFNPSGSRVSFVFGYAIDKTSSKEN